MRRLWIGIVSVIGAALLVLAASAAAAPPDHFTDSGSYSGDASCGSFTNFWSGSFTVNGKTMFDKSGNPVMDVVHQSGSELNWRSGNSDSFTVYFDYNIVYDYATDTTSVNGKAIKVTYPGLGVLLHDVGKIVVGPDGELVAMHGPHDTFEQGQDAYCNALLAIASGK
jgi:hypothetical protein